MEILKNFLLLVGAFLVAIVLFIFLVYFWLRWKLRSWMKSLEGVAGLSMSPMIPPFRVRLERANEPEWTRKQEVDELAAALEEAGFQRIGDFWSEDLAGVWMRALTHSQHCLDAVIYDYDQHGVWFDLVSRYKDGRNLTYTTAPPSGLAHPPFLSIENHPGAEPQELLEHCLTTRPAGDLEPTPASEFPTRFETAHAREMDWRAERGGPTEEEIRAIAARDGNEATPEMVQQVREMWRARLTYEISEELRNAYLNQTKLSAKEWEEVRESLYFVHDRLTESELLDQCETAWAEEYGNAEIAADRDDGEEPDDEGDDRYTQDMKRRREELRPRIQGMTPRAAFATINQTLPPTHRFRKLGEVKQPLAADVYLNPWGSDDEAPARALPAPKAESS
jgi:hypothetical protein